MTSDASRRDKPPTQTGFFGQPRPAGNVGGRAAVEDAA